MIDVDTPNYLPSDMWAADSIAGAAAVVAAPAAPAFWSHRACSKLWHRSQRLLVRLRLPELS